MGHKMQFSKVKKKRQRSLVFFSTTTPNSNKNFQTYLNLLVSILLKINPSKIGPEEIENTSVFWLLWLFWHLLTTFWLFLAILNKLAVLDNLATLATMAVLDILATLATMATLATLATLTTLWLF